MASELNGRRVAAVMTDGVEQVEFTEPRDALRQAGAQVDVIAPHGGKVRGWNHTDWGEKFDVDVELSQADPAQYHALLLPGGVLNPDKLRTIDEALRFVRHFFDAGKPVAAICHGPQILIDADVVRGRRMTSYHAIRRDLENAGADWRDEECVVDDSLVTSRNPGDLPIFCRRVVRLFAERTQPQAAPVS